MYQGLLWWRGKKCPRHRLGVVHSAALLRMRLGAAIVLFAFTLRLWGLNATSLWYDETFVLHYARQGPIPAVIGLLRDDNAIPLHGLLVALWGQVMGWSEFEARYLSVILGTLTVPLVFRLGRAVGQKQVSGLGSALAYATLPIFVYYNQEVRMYALATLLAAGFAWSGWCLLARRSSWHAVGYVVLGLLMLLSHLYTFLVWAVLGLYGTGVVLFVSYSQLDAARGKCLDLMRQASWWLLPNLILAFIAVPVVIWAIWRTQIDATAVSAIPVDVLRWLPILFGVGQYLHRPWPLLFAIGALFAIGVAVLQATRAQRWRSLLWYALSLTLPLVLLFLTTLVKAKWSERYLLPSWGLALVLAVGNGWECLVMKDDNRTRRHQWLERGVGLFLIGLWLGPGSVALARQAQGNWAVALRDEWHPRPDFRGAAAYIEARGAPGDAVVVVGGYAVSNFDYYYHGPAHVFGLPLDVQVLDTTRVVDLHALDILEWETQRQERLWLVLWQQHLADPTNLVQSVLVEQCQRLPVDASLTNVSILLFDLSGCRPLNRLTLPPVSLDTVMFEAPIRLLGYALIRTERTWEVDLWWESVGNISEDYIVFVHLIGPDGQFIAQDDHIAGSDSYPTSMWQVGTHLRDRFFLALPVEECEACVLRVGLYTPERRLLLQDGSDAVEIAVP